MAGGLRPGMLGLSMQGRYIWPPEYIQLERQADRSMTAWKRRGENDTYIL